MSAVDPGPHGDQDATLISDYFIAYSLRICKMFFERRWTHENRATAAFVFVHAAFLHDSGNFGGGAFCGILSSCKTIH